MFAVQKHAKPVEAARCGNALKQRAKAKPLLLRKCFAWVTVPLGQPLQWTGT
jgi:hypothetical protein